MASSPATPSQAQTAPHSIVLEAVDTGRKISPLSVGSWALYDFANTIFSLNIISVYFPAFIIRDLQLNDWVYAYPMSASLLVVALISPLLGAMSDRGGGRRMPWLIGTTLLCVTMTAVMGLVSNLWLVVAALILANIGYQTALVFYDALLPSVSTTLNWGKVSGIGVGLGYAGALAGGAIVDSIVRGGPNQAAFLPTAALFLLFALPCFLFVRERTSLTDDGRRTIDDGSEDTGTSSPSSIVHRPSSAEGPASGLTWRGSLTQTWRTIQDIRQVPGLFIFLVANFFYSDALNTVIVAMGVYATQVIGFTSAFQVLAPAIIAAVLGSFLFGFVTDRLTSKQAITISLLMWVGVFVAAMLITDKFIFQYVIATVAGIALGSTWTAARTMMIELSPREKLGEFMGIYNLTGKFSAVLGPLLWGTTLVLLDPRQFGQFAYQVAIGTLLLMVLLGFGLHQLTPNIKRK